MNEQANTNEAARAMQAAKQPDGLSRLEDLAAQAHMFAQNACLNLLHLGRVLTEARPLIPHGEFDGWCREHAKMSRRTAEQYMQAYAEFGLDSRIAELGTTKIIKLLPMTPEERERLLTENDVGSMSTRQLEAAIRQQKEALRAEAYAEAQAEIDAAREAAHEAERRAMEAESRPAEVPEEVTDQLRANSRTIEQQRAEIERLAGIGQDAVAERQRLQQEVNGLRRDLKERDEDIEAMQADYDRAQEALLTLQSAQARGDAERIPADSMTADAFTLAVNTFIGTCCRVPQMARAFSRMPDAEREAYEQALQTVESWARGARLAMNCAVYEEATIVG